MSITNAKDKQVKLKRGRSQLMIGSFRGSFVSSFRIVIVAEGGHKLCRAFVLLNFLEKLKAAALYST